MKNISKTKNTALAGLFCALAFLCVVVFRFKVQFLTFDIKDAFIAIAAMLLGPLWGLAIAVVTAFIEMITISDTQIYGFVMNVLSTAALTVTASVIYKYNRSMKGAVTGLISGAFALVAVMLAANLIITPYYMGTTTSTVVKLIPKLLLPFNAIKAAVNVSLTMILYKPITAIFRRACLIPGRNPEVHQTEAENQLAIQYSGSAEKRSTGKKTFISIAVSLVVIVVSLYVLFAVLDGSLSWFIA